MKKFGYENLEVWKRAVDFAVKVIDLVEKIDTGRRHYRLFEQIEASSTSISMNSCPVKQLEGEVYYTYVLQSIKDVKFYTGFTKGLKLRFERHNKGLVESTKDRRPLKLIYYEACLSQEDATKREKYLKSYLGKQFLHNRLKSYLTG